MSGVPTALTEAEWIDAAVEILVERGVHVSRSDVGRVYDALAARSSTATGVTECGAIPPNVGGPVPCHLPSGHDGQHFSTSGCAGSEIRWVTAGDDLRDRVAALLARLDRWSPTSALAASSAPVVSRPEAEDELTRLRAAIEALAADYQSYRWRDERVRSGRIDAVIAALTP